MYSPWPVYHDREWECMASIPAAKKGVMGLPRSDCVSFEFLRRCPPTCGNYSGITYPEGRGTSFRGETYWQMVRMRGGFGVRGGGLRWCRRKRRGEVWREFARSALFRFRNGSVAALPIRSEVASPRKQMHFATHCNRSVHNPLDISSWESCIMASSLASSVTSLQSSLQLLDNSITTLDSGVNDFPRLCKVLQTTRVWYMMRCTYSRIYL